MSPASQSRLLVGFLLIAAPATAQQVGYADLTDLAANPFRHERFTPDDSCGELIGGGVGGGASESTPTRTLKLSLLSVDTPELQPGGDVLVLLRFQNLGRASISIPWTTDPEAIDHPDENGTFEFSEADLRATIARDGRPQASLSLPAHLYGSKRATGSLQEIGPGEYVELRAKLTLECVPGESSCESLQPGPADLSFTWTEFNDREKYEKCGVQSFLHVALQLDSNTTIIEILPKAE